MREINTIIIHASASGWGDAAIIDVWHKARGWNGIGYHYVITNGRRESGKPYRPSDDGIIETGRPEAKIGAHTKGQNANSIAICLIANWWFTPTQLHVLHALVSKLQERYGSIPVYGHNHFNKKKTCPNIPADLLALITKGKI